MNKIKWITSDGSGKVSFGFANAADAETFLKSQSSNNQWLSEWTLEFLNTGDVAAIRSTHFSLILKD